MGFGTLAVVTVVGLLGPLLALPTGLRLPVLLGELAAGVLLGPTVAGYLNAGDPTFAFLADIGFALVMFVAGSHVPIRDRALLARSRTGLLRAAAVAALAVPLGLLLARGFGTGHGLVYAVLIASSSAALVLPIVQSLRLSGPGVLELLPQVSIADTACIVAVPLVIDPARAGRAALGALALVGCSAVLFVVLWRLNRAGRLRPLHELSERRAFALELRISLTVLFGLAALATRTHVSVMLAGFCLGLVVAAVGEPRRLAGQLFGVSDGFFAPLFFVWLGASLDLRQLGRHPQFIALGVLLGLAAVAAHAAMRPTGQPLALGTLAAAQLGVPVAAATLGTREHLLAPGEAAALLLSAVVTIGLCAVAGARAAPVTAAPPG